MIRFDIYSNAANSDHGLQRFPALENLTETFRMWSLETKFIRQVFREEEEINVASSKHAAGVKVRSKAVREMAPESHIRGCLIWMRAVVSRPDRGLHLAIEKVRTSNGGPLVFGQIMARKQRVFVSGLEADQFSRLTAQADIDCEQIPDAISRSPELKSEYLARATRPASFFSVIQRLVELELVSAKMMEPLKELLVYRKSEQLKTLTEAQIINLALIHEYLERYEKLILQMTQMLRDESILGDLPQMFELFTQGIPFEHLKKAFSEFALEEKKERIKDKRSLVNEIRIGLSRGDEANHPVFHKRFARMVLRARIRQDPKLYKMAIFLPAMDGQTLEAMSMPRNIFREWLTSGGGAADLGPEETPVPPEISQGLFELAVNMVFQGKFTQSYQDGSLPISVEVARNLLHCFTFDQFEIKGLYKLHPNMPPRGVAKNLSAKVPMTHGELTRIKTALLNVLFPLGNMAMEISKAIATKIRNREEQKQGEEMNAYLMGAISQVNGLNYVLGHSGLTPVLRAAALAAGKMLGLTMIESRDQIHRKHESPRETGGDAPEDDDDDGLKGGYQLLMVADDRRLFPIKASPLQMAATYQMMVEDHIALRVRRLVSKKLNYLVDLHGDGLFSVIHDHLLWNHRLVLSQEQIGTVLMSKGVFDLPRLKEFGFRAKGQGNAATENIWLKSTLAADEDLQRKLFGKSMEEECKKALEAFESIIKSFGPPPAGGGLKGDGGGKEDDGGKEDHATSGDGKTPGRALKSILAELADNGQLDPHGLEFAEALEQSTEAVLLTEELRAAIEPHAPELLEDLEEGESIEVRLSGPAAFLTLLRQNHELEFGGVSLRVRLKPARNLRRSHLDTKSKEIGDALVQRMKGADRLKDAVVLLHRYDEAWTRLVQIMAIPIINQILQETVLTLAKPTPPLPADLPGMPESEVLCMSASSSDQAKFYRIVQHADRRDVYATLSEMASWLLRFQRLREEMAYYREIAEDTMEIIAGFNMSAFDAPYISRYNKMLKTLAQMLSIRPEELTTDDLEALEKHARDISMMVREAYDQERGVGLRDRWMGRIGMRLRGMHPNIKPTFVNVLFEKKAPAATPVKGEGAGGKAKGENGKSGRVESYQTFSERVRNVVEVRERLDRKKAFVMSPSHTQRQLTLNLLDHLQRLKGMQIPIFIDISLCQAYVNVLRTRVPPYRLFTLSSL